MFCVSLWLSPTYDVLRLADSRVVKRIFCSGEIRVGLYRACALGALRMGQIGIKQTNKQKEKNIFPLDSVV